jgi:uncharacterized protein (DUF362 family)
MPKMKTHHWAGATLSMKNCFGCMPGRIYGWPKNVLHWSGLQEAIVDIAGAVRPDLQLVDGIVAMQGNGPIDGTAVDAGVLVFGTDPVATDTTAAMLMGLDPTGIWYLREAGRFLGPDRPRAHPAGRRGPRAPDDPLRRAAGVREPARGLLGLLGRGRDWPGLTDPGT